MMSGSSSRNKILRSNLLQLDKLDESGVERNRSTFKQSVRAFVGSNPHRQRAGQRIARDSRREPVQSILSEPLELSTVPTRSTDSPYLPPLTETPDREVSAIQRYDMPAHTATDNALVLAIDYGTTCTAVAYSRGRSRIEVIRDWGPSMSNVIKVKSALSYNNPLHYEQLWAASSARMASQAEWGLAISPESVSMVNTKLELESNNARLDELDLTLQTMRGFCFLGLDDMKQKGPTPTYPPHGPEQVVKDYLRNIYQRTIKDLKDNGIDVSNAELPVDLVITTPVGWSYNAKDAIYRAIRLAGFNSASMPGLRETIMLTEPEAASYSTALNLRENGADKFEVGDCFILADAGGGTVDVVSFKVDQLRPDLSISLITEPTGGRYGSTLIDREFKQWLRNVIGYKLYEKIDPLNAEQKQISPNASETGEMRIIIARFNDEKHRFSSKLDRDRDIIIELPSPLDNVTSENGEVRQGALTIPRDVMKQLMSPCVNGVLELIRAQQAAVQKADGRRVWDILLVGGFGASPYLQEILKKSLAPRGERQVNVLISNDEEKAAAVAKGAVIYGQEKGRHENAMYLSATAYHYGVLVNDKFTWLLKTGQLTSPNEERAELSDKFMLPYSMFEGAVGQPDGSGDNAFKIYCYQGRKTGQQFPPTYIADGRSEVRQLGQVTYKHPSLVSAMHAHLINSAFPKTGTIYVGPLYWRFKLTGRQLLKVELLLSNDDAILGEVQILLKHEA